MGFDTKLRISVITNSLSGGGAERAINTLVNSLETSKYEITLVPVNVGRADKIQPSCRVIELNRPQDGGIFSLVKGAIRLQKHFLHFRPKYVVLNCSLPELLGAITFGRHRIIVVEHSSMPWFGRKNLGRIVRCILKIRKSLWIVVSKDLGVWSSRSIKPLLIPNAIDFQSSAPGTQKRLPRDGSRKQRLVFIGRLSAEKQPMLFLQIAQLTGYSSIVIGDGPLKYEMERFVELKSLDCQFVGHVTDPWVMTDENDLLLVTSKTEGDGLVVAEAILRNFPMLVNDISDLQRFNLPRDFYCSDIQDFRRSISEYMKGNLLLSLTDTFIQNLADSRDPRLIAGIWEGVLK
jgi:glycosyltransferase involved in cell wall biosynthesis